MDPSHMHVQLCLGQGLYALRRGDHVQEHGHSEHHVQEPHQAALKQALQQRRPGCAGVWVGQRLQQVRLLSGGSRRQVGVGGLGDLVSSAPCSTAVFKPWGQTVWDTHVDAHLRSLHTTM